MQNNAFIIVSYSTLSSHPVPPPEVARYVDQQLWTQLRLAVDTASTNANLTACLGEWICCLITFCWCIFCVHPFIFDNLREGELRREVNNINYSRFNGNPAISVSPGAGLQINTALVAAGNIQIHTITINQPPPIIVSAYDQAQPASYKPSDPVEAYAVPIDQSNASANPNEVTEVILDASNPSSGYANQGSTVRTMTVTLPANVYPYAVLRVQSPEGLQVSVTAPKDAVAGKQIRVQY